MNNLVNFDLTILGTGSASPQLDRNPSACILSLDTDLLLIDCGEGTQYRLLEHKVKHNRIRHILISHLHGDHYFGLIGLLSSFNLARRTEPLTLIGPPGLNEILSIQFQYSETDLCYDLEFIETRPQESSLILDHPRFTIETIPLSHRVPCNGYLIREKTSKRKIKKEVLPPNLPIPYIKSLIDGVDVKDERTGEVFKVEDLTIPAPPARSFAYCSDTQYLPSLIDVVRGVDLLYHEATFDDALVDRAAKTFHSTARQAATIAQAAGVGQLVISHFSSRYKSLDSHLSEAKSVFPNTLLAEEGLTVSIGNSQL